MASQADVAVAMKRLKDAMPPPRGVDPAKAFEHYFVALQQFDADEINEAITNFIRGDLGGLDISLNFYPRPPQLALLVRQVHGKRAVAAADEAKKENPNPEPKPTPGPRGQTAFLRKWEAAGGDPVAYARMFLGDEKRPALPPAKPRERDPRMVAAGAAARSALAKPPPAETPPLDDDDLDALRGV